MNEKRSQDEIMAGKGVSKPQGIYLGGVQIVYALLYSEI
jgi:hypothetical protein